MGNYKPCGQFSRVAETFFVRVDIPCSVEQVPWNEEAGKAREVDKLSIDFCGDHETAEVAFRTVVSVNQPSSYGAVADLCEELALSNSGNPSAGTGRHVAAPQTKDGKSSRRRPTDQIVLREKFWLEMTDRQDPNDGFVETRKWVLCWK